MGKGVAEEASTAPLVRQTVVGDLALQSLHEFQGATLLAIARKMRERWPEVFPSVERARSALRYYTGAKGETLRTVVDKKLLVNRTEEQREQAKTWGMIVPQPVPTGWQQVPLPTGPRRWLCISDIHIPYHDHRALTAALAYGQQQGCDGLLLNGDIIDGVGCSHWLRDPRARRVREELEMTAEWLKGSIRKLDVSTTVWKEGNHDARMNNYMMQHAPDLYDMPTFNLAAEVSRWALPVQMVNSMDVLRRGKLTILHGHELPKGLTNPVNPARGAFLRMLSCCIMGHLHRTSDHTEMTFDGVTVTCWSTGCLCDLHPLYSPINRWNHGFAIIDTPSDGQWRIYNLRIVDGEVM